MFAGAGAGVPAAAGAGVAGAPGPAGPAGAGGAAACLQRVRSLSGRCGVQVQPAKWLPCQAQASSRGRPRVVEVVQVVGGLCCGFAVGVQVEAWVVYLQSVPHLLSAAFVEESELLSAHEQRSFVSTAASGHGVRGTVGGV